MLAGPRRVRRAGLPLLSRSRTYGTVRLSASHAVFAPDAAIVSWVTSELELGIGATAPPDILPPQAADASGPTSESVRCTNRNVERAGMRPRLNSRVARRRRQALVSFDEVLVTVDGFAGGWGRRGRRLPRYGRAIRAHPRPDRVRERPAARPVRHLAHEHRRQSAACDRSPRAGRLAELVSGRYAPRLRIGPQFELRHLQHDTYGSLLVQLTADTAFDGQPAWSPDGANIALASTR